MSFGAAQSHGAALHPPQGAGSQTAPQHLLKQLASGNTPLVGACCTLIAAIISSQHLQPLWTLGLKAAAMWFQSGLSEEGVHAALCLPPCTEALLKTGPHTNWAEGCSSGASLDT